MSKIDYPRSSPYALTPQTNWHIGRYVHRTFPPSPGDKTFVLTPTYQYRPDRLSQDLYGTPALWWVFAVRNPNLLHDPVWDFTAGKTIFIPSAETLSGLGM